jgi:LacI family transcriptional regulator
MGRPPGDATGRPAFGACQAPGEAGIPGDVSRASFDNAELASYLRPGLTTIALPHEAMGRRAVEMLLDRQTSGEALIPMPAVIRGSLRKP